MKKYIPLFVLVAVAAMAGVALDFADGFDFAGFMHYFMGVALLIFACLKLFDVEGFQQGFARYDILAKKFQAYGYVYPFLELILALGYLSFAVPILIYIATIVLFAIGLVGVIRSLWAGVETSCSCMGSSLSVPLSVVTLGEDLFMLVMASAMLWERFL